MELQAGQMVKYSKPESAGEAACRFIVIEPRGDRVLVRLVCELPIPPMECIPVSEVSLA